MLSLLKFKPALYAALVVGVLVAASLLIGYQRGHANAELACANARAEAERQVAQSLAELARQYTQADAEAERLRAEARRLAGEVTRLRDEKFDALPDAGFGLDESRRLLIHSSYCARFPESPSCLPN